ncbi:peptidylprolyl isomerase [Roseateles sp. GG27B]
MLELYTKQAPLSTANFLRYVDEGFYNGLLFHRVIHEGGSVPGGVIQGGGCWPGLMPKAPSHPAISLESNNGLKNTRYTVAMARARAPDSTTRQFRPLRSPSFN